MRVILIEDNPADEELIRRLLEKAPGLAPEIESVSQYADAAKALERPFDVCLIDYNLGDYSAFDLLSNVSVQDLPGPIIYITGYEDFEIDQAALDLGVADYITKTQLTPASLGRTLRYCRRHYEDQRNLSFLAQHDPLTRLLNRHAFLDRLSTRLQGQQADSQNIHLFYIGLDGLKAINDNWGHEAGDQALQHASLCLFNAVLETDLVARYGSDELVAAITNVEQENIEQLAQKLLNAIRTPFEVCGEEIVMTASIGICRASQAPENPLEVIRLADHAMFAAKNMGRDGFQIYSSSVPVPARSRAQMKSDLRRALNKDALHLVYQPQFDLNDGRLTGAEALARWNHPTQGAIGPNVFIPLAEESGLIRKLTFWSIKAAIVKLESWAEYLAPDFRLSVNVSPTQLLQPEFEQRFKDLLRPYPNAYKWLRLEITESFFLHKQASKQLNTLRDIGVSLALDDFGTGYSSLSQLAQLPIDTLKIDMAFVQNITVDSRMAALTRAIISIAQELSMDVIAEGVETQQQADLLASYGCKYVQGFLFAAGEDEVVFTQRLQQSGSPTTTASPIE